MNICKISSIKPGKPWDSQHGRMYPSFIVFEDGVRGNANSKTEIPPYKVGDKVGYEITGTDNFGQNKLKIDRKADPAVCKDTTPESHPDLEAAPAAVYSQGGQPYYSAAPQSKPVSPREQAFHGGGGQKPANGQDTAKAPPHDATICWAIGKAVELAIQDQAWDDANIESKARRLLAIHANIKNPDPDDSSVPF